MLLMKPLCHCLAVSRYFVIATVSALALASGSLSAQIALSEVSVPAGIAGDIYKSPARHGLGVNWVDYDLDGWPDLFLVGGGPDFPPHLFHNERDGSFSRADHLLPALPKYSMSGSRFADVDRDGDPDIFIYTGDLCFRPVVDDPRCNAPDGYPNLLLKNLWVENEGVIPAGEALFEEVAEAAGLADLASPPLGALPSYRSMTAAWFDYDRDGCIDLYVGNFHMNAGGSETNRDRLYRNLCNEAAGQSSVGIKFEDVTAESGINPGDDPRMNRTALASIAAHLNHDLWPDLYVVNITGLDDPIFHEDFIYFGNSDGTGNGVFAEVGAGMPGVGDSSAAGMGIDVADIDLDGNWDIYISDIFVNPNLNLEVAPVGNPLYFGTDSGSWSNNSADAAGVQGADSWGVNFFDIDRDGWEDLFISSMRVDAEFLYSNNRDRTFTDVAADVGMKTGFSRGSAVADYDRDGDVDLAVVNQDGGLQLFRNDTQNAGHWLAFELVATESNRDAIGAVVKVEAGSLKMMRQIKGGSSAHSQNSLVVHFGLGEATTAERVHILWPSGIETELLNLRADRFVTVVEEAKSENSGAVHPMFWMLSLILVLLRNRRYRQH